MAAQVPFKEITLTEEDVPGAKLPNTRVISGNSVIELKRYLVTRGVRLGHNIKKDELVELVTKVLAENRPVNTAVDNGKWLAGKAMMMRNRDLDQIYLNNRMDVFPVNGWKQFPSRPIPHLFCYGSIYKHVIDTATVVVVGDEEENVPRSFATAKPLRKGRQFFVDGHVKEMEDASSIHGHFCVKAKVQASMKNEDYIVMVKLKDVSGEVLDAECHCKASSMSRCSHISALLLAIEDYTIHYGYTPPSCTSKICEWNKGRQVKSSAPVYSRKYSNIRDPSRVIKRKAIVKPLNMQKLGDLLKYSSQQTHLEYPKSMWNMLFQFNYCDYKIGEDRIRVLQVLRDRLQSSLKFGLEEAPNCVKGTEAQASSNMWRRLRSLMITASSCPKFLTNDIGDLSKKLDDLMWKPNAEIDNIYMKYGRDNEDIARNAYEELTGNEVSKTGLWVNPKYPGLGASPDGLVKCKETGKMGLLEIKCCFVLKDHKPTDVDKLTKRQQYGHYLKQQGGFLHLNKSHSYFKQVQMQLGITQLPWCDFVVWTSKGLFIERISGDDEWWSVASRILVDIHATYICPEYFAMRLPRKLPPIQLV